MGEVPFSIEYHWVQQHCSATGYMTVGAVDNFMWFGELHPSERADQIIAQEFAKVVEGSSTYATYWSSA
jgi:hypothetical protein